MTTKVLKLLVIAVSIAISAWAQSQASCQALVQQGIYDTFSSSTNVSDYSEFISQLCNSTSQSSNNQANSASSAASSNQDSSDNTETTSTKVSAIISVTHTHTVTNDESSSAEDSDDGQLSSSQMAALVQYMCNSANSQSGSTESLNQLSQVIDPNVISAYEECLAATASGLQTSTTIRQDQCQVTIQLNYVPPVGAPDKTTIYSIEISPSSAWECSGSLWNLVESNSNASLSTNSVAMSCTRNVSETPFTYQNELVYAEPSTITINAASANIVRNFSSIPASLPEYDISSVTQAINQLEGYLSDLSDALQLENETVQGNLSSFSASLQSFSDILSNVSSTLSDLSDNITQQEDTIARLQNYTITDIAETCYDFSLEDTTFYATCNYTSESGAMTSCWDLADCVGVLDGQFICIPGVTAVSITDLLALDGTILSSEILGAAADLSNFLTNRNGRLECQCVMN